MSDGGIGAGLVSEGSTFSDRSMKLDPDKEYTWDSQYIDPPSEAVALPLDLLRARMHRTSNRYKRTTPTTLVSWLLSGRHDSSFVVVLGDTIVYTCPKFRAFSAIYRANDPT